MSVEFEDHSEEILDALQAATLRGLERVGMQAQGYAQDLCPVDTGNLRNSISHKADEKEQAVYIGTNVEYAPYIELGTGIYNPEGRKTPWVYKDDKGNWRWTRGAQAQPFLKPAASEHGQTYRNILEDELKDG